MIPAERLTSGERHRWRVQQRAPFGMIVEAVDLPTRPVGVVDLYFMPEDIRGRGWIDFPAVGAVVEAVVQGYTLEGQLRLTMLPADLEA